MNINRIIMSKMLGYAKYTITDRAIPSIDGLKPVQRRIMYTMHNLGLDKANASPVKSVKVVGDTMGKYHPHGDKSIYSAMIMMSDAYEALNVPYVHGDSSFGKRYTRDIEAASMRYTEAKLAPISKEFFEGIDEGSIEMVRNFDNTENEPKLLPVKFPNILVNASDGIAVGISSCIPSYSLTSVCKATKGIIQKTINNNAELAEALGAPQFTTGGFLHASKESLEKLCATGRGSFVISGKVELYADRIVVREIPYTTTVEKILEDIDTAVKENKIKGIKDAVDAIGLDGLEIEITLKSGYNSREVLNKLCRYTTLRDTISYNTSVIINDRVRQDLGVWGVIEEWVKFREECIVKLYNNRLKKVYEEEHIQETWSKINGRLKEVIEILVNLTEEQAKQKLKTEFWLDDIQADYMLDTKVRAITKDRVAKALEEIEKIALKKKEYELIVNDQNHRLHKICDELDEIIEKYGKEQKTALADEIVEDKEVEKNIVNDEATVVVITKNGFVRRISGLKDLAGKYVSNDGEEEVTRWNTRNNEYILVFDVNGTVHKVLVDDIDQSRGKMTSQLHKMAGLEKMEDIVYVDVSGDYSGYFNIVYNNGRGQRVYYSDVSGKRKQYRNLYPSVEQGKYKITKEDRFFMVTQRRKAAYCDLTNLGLISSRKAFKVARISKGDNIAGLIAYDSIPSKEIIDLNKYNKEYTVLIGDDILW